MGTGVPAAGNLSLGAVSETLLIPLYYRAIESLSRDPIISDPKAVEITRELDVEFSRSDRKLMRDLAAKRLPSKLVASMALRTRRFDRYVQDFLGRNPGGVVLDLGCGLDTRFPRVDNGAVEWYELDLPEVIRFKRRFFSETDRFHLIASSVLDLDWMDPLRDGRARPVLAYAEGLFMYLTEEQVRPLVLALASAFPGAELVCEMASKFAVDLMRTRMGKRKFQRRFHLRDEVVFTFGIESGRELERWGPNIKFLDEWTFFDESERKLGWYRLFKHFRSFRYAQWTVHYRLG